MKGISLLTLLILMFFASVAQTNGKLNVTVATSSAGGNYSPKNVFVIWIEDASGNFVKTLSAYADRRIQYLYKWSASTSAKTTQYSRVDAVTGATLGGHSTRTGTWNGTNYNKIPVADGNYFVCMELTDKHAQGHYARFPFTKGANNKTTPANVTGFSSIAIDWVSSAITASEITEIQDDIQIIPNPSQSRFSVKGADISKIEVLSIEGHLLFINDNTTEIDLSNFADSIYLVRIKSGDKTIVRKLVKKL